MSGGRRKDTPPSVVGRALSILDCFTPSNPVLRLSEISQRTGLPLSTVFRFVGDLCEWGALDRTADLRYQIGSHLCRVAAARATGEALSPPRA